MEASGELADWDLNDASVSRRGRKVLLEVFTAGHLNPIIKFFEKVARPESVTWHKNYQRLRIRFRTPALSLEAAILLASDEEVKAIEWLRRHCGEPKIYGAGDGKCVFEWRYGGDGIYYGGSLKLGGFVFRVRGRGNW